MAKPLKCKAVIGLTIIIKMDIFDFTSEKDYKKTLIDHINETFEDKFSKALNSPIVELESEIESLNNEVEELGKDLKNLKDPDTGAPIQEDIDIILMQADLQYDIYWLKEQLNAISEMKIVYLFKSLEIAMKKLVETAYPKTSLKHFYRWENFKSFFKEKEIELSNISGYQDVIDLRKVNNSIKHSSEISDEINKISEFSGKDFDHESLTDFYERVQPEVDSFLNSLSEKVIEDLFVFDDSRLERIAEEYFKRMEVKDAKLLTNILLSRYNK